MKKADAKIPETKPQTTAKENTDVMPEPVILDKKLYKSLVSTIDREYKKTELSYLKIATTLYRIYEDSMFVLEDYKNIYDFGMERFSLARGTVNNFVNLVKQFCEQTESGEYVLKEGYDRFSSSQLIVMLGMPNEFIASIAPDMSVRSIKDKKREYKQLIDSSAECETVDSEEESHEKPEKTGNKCFLFETFDYSDFTDVEKISVIEDTYNDFVKANKGKKVKFRLYLEV